MKKPNDNIVWHNATMTRELKEKRNGHRSAVLWFTGLPCSGKSTLAYATEERLYQIGCNTFVLDGDNVRHGLCSDLGFTSKDRHENIRRIGETAKLFVEAGSIILTAFISPFKSDREKVRGLLPHGDFLEIFCKCSLEVCEKRDVKGHYKRARSGEIKEYTGISSPYEAPQNPELEIETDKLAVGESVEKILGMLVERGLVKRSMLKKGQR